jgi:hypothetical protein
MRAGRIGTAAFVFMLWTSVHNARAFAQSGAGGHAGGWQPCGSNPTSTQVYIYTEANYGGSCAAISFGFYALPGTASGEFGLPNDSISSIKVGSFARARVFADDVFAGSFTAFTTGNYPAMPSGWDNVVSSIRVEQGLRSATCSDLSPGEFAVFRDAGQASDCVVLYYGGSYPTPAKMGIANDSISSVNPGPAPVFSSCPGPQTQISMRLHSDVDFLGSSATFASGSAPIDLTIFNDITSSIDMVPKCN